MTKRILFDRIQHILDELFVDVSDDKFEFSALGDLFQDSHFRLQDSFVKTDVFNALPLPMDVKVAYIGHIRIEGFWGVMTTGSALRCTISDSLFVFGAKQHIDWTDELQLRYAQEVAVALLHRLWNRYHIEGKGPQKNESTKTWIKKRVTAALHNMTIQVENTHCRVEIDEVDQDDRSTGTTDVVGIVVPTLSVFSTDVAAAILTRRALPLQIPVLTDGMSKVVAIDGVQVYTSRIPTAKWSPDQWKSHFQRQWPTEVHTAVLVPADIKVKVDLEECPATKKLKMRAVDLHVNQLNVGLDPQQIDVLGRLLRHVDMYGRYSRYRKLRPTQIVRSDVDPWPLVILSFNVLPHIQPVDPSAVAPTPRPIAPFPARAMWKYAVRCVLQDLYPSRRDGQDILWLSQLIIQYTELYKRKMGSAYVEFVVRDLVTLHKQQQPAVPPVLPSYAALDRAELWQLSDLMYQLTPDRQLYCRALVDRIIRQEFMKQNAKRAPSDLPRSASSIVRRGSLERLGRVHSFLKDENAWNQVDVEAVLFGDGKTTSTRAASPLARPDKPQPRPKPLDMMSEIVEKHHTKPLVHVDVGHLRFAFRHVDGASAPRKKEWEVNCEFLRGCVAIAALPAPFVLVEGRLGSVMVSIVVPDAADCLVVADCIADPNDGCFYAGLRFDPSNIASEFAWKGKVMTGAIKASVSQSAVDTLRRTLASKFTDESLSLQDIAGGRHKTVFCRPLKPQTAPSKQSRLKAFLEHVLQLPTMMEVQTKAVSIDVRAPTHQVINDVLSTKTWVPFVGDVALSSVEVAEVTIPGNRWAIAHDIAANVVEVDALQHRVRFRNSRAGHVAAIQRVLHQLFPSA